MKHFLSIVATNDKKYVKDGFDAVPPRGTIQREPQPRRHAAYPYLTRTGGALPTVERVRLRLQRSKMEEQLIRPNDA